MRALGFFVAAALFATPAGADESAQWHFEALSADGHRALLRRLDPEMRSAFDVRVVDVDSGAAIETTVLDEMARVPASTIGGKPTELAALEFMLASPAFGRDLVHGAHIAAPFPFGACGRLAAAGSAIAFDAGDWLYVADADGRVRRRLVEEAAYDPRFTPDGKWLFFRRATGRAGAFARYELFVSPADLSTPPKVVLGTAGMHDRFVVHPDGKTAFAVASVAGADTCFVSLALKPPFTTKRLACVDGGERVVESVISPKGKWAAVTTKKRGDAQWRLRILSLATGKVLSDEPESPGLALRAISDTGQLVESGARGALVVDVAASTIRALPNAGELGHRAFFRSDTELVYATPSGLVGTVDVTKE